jgi:hypothetical protein
MIMVVISGGIGNQLQQFAYGYSLSKEKKMPLILDLAWFKSNNILNKSNGLYTGPCLLQKIIGDKNLFIVKNAFTARFLRLIFRLVHFFSFGICGYNNVQLDSPFKIPKLSKASNYFINGTPNNLNFFKKNIPSIVKKFITPGKKESSKIKIGIHVRKGNYTQSILDVCTRKYYLRALKLILKKKKLKKKDIELLIFSNKDNNWCKDNINFKNIKKKIIIGNIKSTIKDLTTMMTCSHFIIPNSSFSWWAAQYVDHINKGVIVGPDLWWDRVPAKKINIYNKNWLIVKTGFKINKNSQYKY